MAMWQFQSEDMCADGELIAVGYKSREPNDRNDFDLERWSRWLSGEHGRSTYKEIVAGPGSAFRVRIVKPPFSRA